MVYPGAVEITVNLPGDFDPGLTDPNSPERENLNSSLCRQVSGIHSTGFTHISIVLCIVVVIDSWILLLTWINFNPCVDK